MEGEILELRKKKYTIDQIAQQLGITVGQVKYRLYQKNGKQDTEQPKNEKAHQTLPLYYGELEMALMVQGPTVLFAYWEITWPVMNMLSDYLNLPYEHIDHAIRLYDVTDLWFNGSNAHTCQEITIDSATDNWFFHELQPGRTYIAERGIRHGQHYLPLVQSKPKATPPNQEAGEYNPLVPRIAIEPNERVKPRWFENFSAYTLY
ncbi:DUF4912 domain-containing protein [Ammoniphilus sp. YIM 78166]|uniref:DUF4912 domain-containing protein n=1 Tax=Ammoniphilus sp. YIM 78166 TaxID=1644106 RepID=UPI00106F1823|nr:DUF4912 domain-containing protein [Ammoniphilus sp. YIM 78166]